MNAELRDLIFVGAVCAALGFAAGQSVPCVWTPENDPRTLMLSSEAQNILNNAKNKAKLSEKETLAALSAARIRLMQDVFEKNYTPQRLNDANNNIEDLAKASGLYWNDVLNALPPSDRRVYLKWYAKNRRFFENKLTESLLPPVPEKNEKAP